MSAERVPSHTVPPEPEPAIMQPLENPPSPHSSHDVPLMVGDDETVDEEPQRESRLRRFFRAIGFGWLMHRGKREDNYSVVDRSEERGTTLRATTIQDVRDSLNRDVLDSEGGVLDSEDESVYSSNYGGTGGGHFNPYMLYLGTEKTTNYKPSFVLDVKPGEPHIVDLSELRPSMTERQLPVFFTPPPQDVFNSVMRKSSLTIDSAPGSPMGVFA